jgi:hypothetical protein
MKTLLTSSKWRWFTSFVAVALIIVTSFFLQNASGKSRRFIPVSGFAQRTAIYRPDVAGFTFSTPQALTHPPIPATPGVSLKDQDVEPEIKVDIFGNIYVTAIHGVPGGIDLWKSTDQGNTFVYLGEPDGAQDKCNVMGMAPCVGGAGGGDDSIDVSSGGYLYVSS